MDEIMLTDPRLEHARTIIEKAVQDCANGGDLWLNTAIAAQQILQGIITESVHHYTNCEPGPWKRMPPELRAAIAAAMGGVISTGSDYALLAREGA